MIVLKKKLFFFAIFSHLQLYLYSMGGGAFHYMTRDSRHELF